MNEADFRSRIPAETNALLNRYGFDFDTFDTLRKRVQRGAEQNHTKAALYPPLAEDIRILPPLGSDERRMLDVRGRELIAQGTVAAVVLAGGMATRFGGVVKAAVKAVAGQTFFELKRADLVRLAEQVQGSIPFLAMSSFATHEALLHLASQHEHERVPTSVFPQSISLRLTPEGDLFLDEHGVPSPYAPGHGDLAPCLRGSGQLDELQKRGVRYLFMTNVDNLPATLDPALIGAHAENGCAMTFEVTPPRPHDQGGRPVRIDGKLQVLEAFRFPDKSALEQVPYFSTNSFVFDLEALDAPFPLTWFWVQKTVAQRPAIQFERLVNELSAFLPCRAIAVPRQGDDGRFLPVKEPSDLLTSAIELERVLRVRGVLSSARMGDA